MKVLLDVNVLLDFLIGREPWDEDAAQVFAVAQAKNIDLYVSGDGFSTLAYFLQREVKPRGEAHRRLGTLLTNIHVAPVDGAVVRSALGMGMKDLEDAIQAAAAVRHGISIIVTRDEADFRGAEGLLTIKSPKGFAAALSATPGLGLERDLMAKHRIRIRKSLRERLALHGESIPERLGPITFGLWLEDKALRDNPVTISGAMWARETKESKSLFDKCLFLYESLDVLEGLTGSVGRGQVYGVFLDRLDLYLTRWASHPSSGGSLLEDSEAARTMAGAGWGASRPGWIF